MEKMESWNPDRGLTEKQRDQLKAELEKVQVNQDSSESEALELLAEAKDVLAKDSDPGEAWWQKAKAKRREFEKLEDEKEKELKTLSKEIGNPLSVDADPEELEKEEKLGQELEQIRSILEKLSGQFGDK